MSDHSSLCVKRRSGSLAANITSSRTVWHELECSKFDDRFGMSLWESREQLVNYATIVAITIKYVNDRYDVISE